MVEELIIHVDDAGRLRFVWADSCRDLLSLGAATINRASHVEPTKDCRWTADLSPIGGPVLGPFDTREQALLAEIEELERRLSDHGCQSA